jgi:hypothetical protein
MKKLRSRFAGIFLSQGITTPFNMPAIDKATPMLEGAHYGYTTADKPMQPLNQLNFVRKLGEETRSSHPHTNVPIVCSVKYIIINVPMLHMDCSTAPSWAFPLKTESKTTSESSGQAQAC